MFLLRRSASLRVTDKWHYCWLRKAIQFAEDVSAISEPMYIAWLHALWFCHVTPSTGHVTSLVQLFSLLHPCSLSFDCFLLMLDYQMSSSNWQRLRLSLRTDLKGEITWHRIGFLFRSAVTSFYSSSVCCGYLYSSALIYSRSQQTFTVILNQLARLCRVVLYCLIQLCKRVKHR